MTAPAPEQVIGRETEHQRIRARAASIRQPRRRQIILAPPGADWPAWLLPEVDAAERAQADAEWNARVEP
jgi:hypothetical protein